MEYGVPAAVGVDAEHRSTARAAATVRRPIERVAGQHKARRRRPTFKRVSEQFQHSKATPIRLNLKYHPSDIAFTVDSGPIKRAIRSERQRSLRVPPGHVSQNAEAFEDGKGLGLEC